MQRIQNYINGTLVDPVGGEFLDNINPATGSVYAQVPDSDKRDIDKAVQSAREAFPAWSKMPATKRYTLFNKLADLIEANLEQLAKAECIDNGKPLKLARSLDIPRSAQNIRFFGAAILHRKSEFFETDNLAINYTLRQPRGVAGIISPWNLPLYLLTWKVAPALATGNTVVAKPSEVTPMTAYLFSQLCIEAGLPPGVLNIVHGLGSKAGAALVEHPHVPTISFTGGTVTGRAITTAASPMLKKVGLELGGKNPNLVFADADMDQAVAESARAAFANQGQVCLCGSRIYVEESIYPAFVERLVEKAKSLKVGDPLEETSDLGALVSKAQYDKVSSYIDLARQEGGHILCGGGAPEPLPPTCQKGFFISPTVITNLPPDCRVNQEEIFGPVVTVTPFTSEDQVIEYANGTPYGLSACVFTNDLSRAHRVAQRIDAGTIWVNSWMIRDLRVPFGGMKQSGVGREGGDEVIRFYTEPKNVCIRIPDKPAL